MKGQLSLWIARVSILGVCGVLLGAFWFQFGKWEYPCPLCILQRMAMLMCTLGPAYVLARARTAPVDAGDLALGYGMSVLAAVVGAAISSRQILLHIVPPDPGYGEPVMGLHLYTWALVVFITVLVVSGLNLVFARSLQTTAPMFGWSSRLVLGLLAAIILANAVAVFFEEGLHLTLPDSPTRYQLLDDLGLRPAQP